MNEINKPLQWPVQLFQGESHEYSERIMIGMTVVQRGGDQEGWAKILNLLLQRIQGIIVQIEHRSVESLVRESEEYRALTLLDSEERQGLKRFRLSPLPPANTVRGITLSLRSMTRCGHGLLSPLEA